MIIDNQSIADLEFNLVREMLANHCKSSKAKLNALKISPFSNLEEAKREFKILKEIQSVYQDDQVDFPHTNSEDIDHALKVLRVENGVLTLDELVRVYKLCLGTETLIRFAKKHKEIYPHVYEACEHITSVQDVIKIIKFVLNKKLEIDDKASAELFKIRTQLKSIKIEIDKNFTLALSRYKKEEYLDVTEETYLDSRRLLIVHSQHKKKVNGRIAGASSKGAFTYIEPGENIELNKKLDKYLLEETNEIFRILQKITFELRAQKSNLKAFERLLVRFDLYNGKVRLAQTYHGIIPKMSTEKKMYWENAIHPILFVSNQITNTPTIGQDFELSKNTRFLVVSGPNAGGKSITLKTVGLLQTMFQSGLFVPVNDVSEFCWFNQIRSDIGDNQSIYNHLSTYSYRLSRMNTFLKETDAETLVLLDEFGSGSDPELGGALAEVFFEELYDTNCFAVINTHYTNIKIITSSKPEAINAFMLFDTEALKPLYKLSVGQPGSSFTFEVAKLNGIEDDLIKRAHAKVAENKVKLDQLSLDLQKEKSDYVKANKLQLKSTAEAESLIRKFNQKLEELYQKANQQHNFYEQQGKFLKVGKKVYALLEKHLNDENNKDLNLAMKKYMAVEKNKLNTKFDHPALKKGLKAPKIEKPKVIKRTSRSPEPELPKVQKPVIKGSRVRLPGNTKTGVVQSIDGKNAIVMVGNFNITVKTKDLTAV